MKASQEYEAVSVKTGDRRWSQLADAERQHEGLMAGPQLDDDTMDRAYRASYARIDSARKALGLPLR